MIRARYLQPILFRNGFLRQFLWQFNLFQQPGFSINILIIFIMTFSLKILKRLLHLMFARILSLLNLRKTILLICFLSIGLFLAMMRLLEPSAPLVFYPHWTIGFMLLRVILALSFTLFRAFLFLWLVIIRVFFIRKVLDTLDKHGRRVIFAFQVNVQGAILVILGLSVIKLWMRLVFGETFL